MKATQDLFRTADGDVVGEGDSRAQFLLARAGDDVPDEHAKAAKVFLGEQPAEDAPVDDEEPEEKAAAKPADKAVKKTANKAK